MSSDATKLELMLQKLNETICCINKSNNINWRDFGVNNNLSFNQHLEHLCKFIDGKNVHTHTKLVLLTVKEPVNCKDNPIGNVCLWGKVYYRNVSLFKSATSHTMYHLIQNPPIAWRRGNKIGWMLKDRLMKWSAVDYIAQTQVLFCLNYEHWNIVVNLDKVSKLFTMNNDVWCVCVCDFVVISLLFETAITSV